MNEPYDPTTDKMTQEMTTLSLGAGLDGAKWGISDWYDDAEKAIREALDKAGDIYPWTTGWYASKKEVVSGCITSQDGKILCQASVSDDFDAEGRGEIEIDWTDDLDIIREALDKAYGLAKENMMENRELAAYAIISPKNSWVETYLTDQSDFAAETPPGEHYNQWGFQGEADEESLPTATAKRIEAHLDSLPDEETVIDGYTIRPF